jgi:hypothetical protein
MTEEEVDKALEVVEKAINKARSEALMQKLRADDLQLFTYNLLNYIAVAGSMPKDKFEEYKTRFDIMTASFMLCSVGGAKRVTGRGDQGPAGTNRKGH